MQTSETANENAALFEADRDSARKQATCFLGLFIGTLFLLLLLGAAFFGKGYDVFTDSDGNTQDDVLTKLGPRITKAVL